MHLLGLTLGVGAQMCFPSPQTNMPFLSIYLLAMEQDVEYGTSAVQTAYCLQQQAFLQVRGQKVLPGAGGPDVAEMAFL